jgi:hypothetical protein
MNDDDDDEDGDVSPFLFTLSNVQLFESGKAATYTQYNVASSR